MQISFAAISRNTGSCQPSVLPPIPERRSSWRPILMRRRYQAMSSSQWQDPANKRADKVKGSMQFAMLGAFATEGALLLVGLLTGPLAARLLLPEGRGALAAVLFWPQLLAGIGLLSLHEAVTYCVGAKSER